MYRVQIKRALTEPESEVKRRALKKAGFPAGAGYFRIVKKSLDARDKRDIHYLYTIEVDAAPPAPVREEQKRYRSDLPGAVIGMGPAGLFAALFLAILSTVPSVLSVWQQVAIPFGASSILIAVSVALETVRQVESQLVMRNYKGFLG